MRFELCSISLFFAMFASCLWIPEAGQFFVYVIPYSFFFQFLAGCWDILPSFTSLGARGKRTKKRRYMERYADEKIFYLFLSFS